nr:hypothetical protein [Tanacetum cinerariifolium]
MANPDDESMWVADRIIAPTLGPTITIPETANEFAIKDFFPKHYSIDFSEKSEDSLNMDVKLLPMHGFTLRNYSKIYLGNSESGYKMNLSL